MKSKLCHRMQNSWHASHDYMVLRFPRLVRVMQSQAILSSGEAGCALRDYVYARDGLLPQDLMRYGGGEAVAHYGGPLKVIRDAIAARRVWRAIQRENQAAINRLKPAYGAGVRLCE